MVHVELVYFEIRFCHNYRHRSDICMTEFFRLAQNVTDVSFFVVSGADLTLVDLRGSVVT